MEPPTPRRDVGSGVVLALVVLSVFLTAALWAPVWTCPQCLGSGEVQMNRSKTGTKTTCPKCREGNVPLLRRLRAVDPTLDPI